MSFAETPLERSHKPIWKEDVLEQLNKLKSKKKNKSTPQNYHKKKLKGRGQLSIRKSVKQTMRSV